MIDFMMSVFLVTLILLLFSVRLYRLLFWFSVNSLALSVISVESGLKFQDYGMILSGIITFLLKTLFIPLFLKRISKKHSLPRLIQPSIKLPYIVMFIPAIIVITLYLSQPLVSKVGLDANHISAAVSSLFLSLMLIIQHKSVAPKIIGFLTMENALFMLGTTATGGMPMIVELGIFFDLLMAIIVIQLLFDREEVEA